MLLAGHDVRTVAYQGWAGFTNGALLRAAEVASFDAIVTADQGIRYQQNRRNSKVALIVLSDNDESVITANIEAIQAAIEAIPAGALLWVDLGGSEGESLPSIKLRAGRAARRQDDRPPRRCMPGGLK